MTTQTPPDGEAILKDMLMGARMALYGGVNVRVADVETLATHVATLTAERDQLQFEIKAQAIEIEIADATLERTIVTRDAALARVVKLETERYALNEEIDASFCSLSIWATRAWWKEIPGDARDFQRKISFAFSNLCDTHAVIKRLNDGAIRKVSTEEQS